jgi:hypothetical protein
MPQAKTVMTAIGSFISFSVGLIGGILITRSLTIVADPSDATIESPWVIYLHLRYPFDFYMGCGLLSLALAFFWMQRRSKS